VPYVEMLVLEFIFEFQPNVLRAMFSTIRHRAVLRRAGAEPRRFLTEPVPIALSVRTVAQNADISKHLGRVEISQLTALSSAGIRTGHGGTWLTDGTHLPNTKTLAASKALS
jgi:hypothetical protein